MTSNQKLLILMFLQLCISCSNSNKVQSNDINISKPLDSLISGLIENKELIGAELNIYQNGVNSFNKVYGWNNLNRDRKIERNDIWTVKSMTKPVTATAILILRDEGLLSLDDPVTKYIPSYNGYEQSTIRNLLLHNSGDDGSYGNHTANVVDFNSQEDWVMDWAKEAPKGKFGEYDYSNLGYEALGYIVSKVSQQPLAEFIQERIIKPLELKNTHTYFSPSKEWADRVPYRYLMYDNNQIELIQTNKDEQSWKFFTAGFGLWMSNEDFVTFLQMWMNQGKHKDIQILNEGSINEALKIGVMINMEDMAGQGLAWQVEKNPFIYYKGGDDGSLGIAYPDKNMIIVFTTHMKNGNHGDKIWNILGEHLFYWN